MSFKIFEKDKPQEPEVFLRLVEDDTFPNLIKLIACDSAGSRLNAGTLLTISPSGIGLCPCVSGSLGIRLEGHRVRVYDR